MRRQSGIEAVAPAAFTITELLVVITIIMILAAVLVPLMQPVLEGRDTREAARQVNALIAAQQGRAVQRGRPAGIWMEREADESGASVRIFGAEVPPPYAGDTLDARVFIQWPPSAPIGTATFDPPGCCGAAASLVAADDFVKFDYRGPLYKITGTPSATGFSFKLATSGSSPPPETPTDASGTPIPPGVPFQIFRQPRKSAGMPLELPTSTAIDLTLSGVGASGAQFAGGSTPVIILFDPNGRVDRVYSDGFTGRPLSSIHLHIGRFDQVPGSANMADQRNIWVSVGNQTGLVTTAQNKGGASVDVAREYALRAQNMGGN